MNIIFDFLFSLIDKLPISRKMKPFYRLWRRKINSVLRRHPTVVYVIVGVILVFVILNPEILPEWLRPKHTCYSIKFQQGELYEFNGDQLRMSDAERPCKHRTAVAVEWYNWAKSRDKRLKGLSLISAGIFLDGVAVGQSQDIWIERTLFYAVNNFTFRIVEHHAIQQFDAQSLCGYQGNGVSIDRREGFMLSTKEERPGIEDEACYRAPSGTEPGYEYCKFHRLQLFIPTQNLCPEVNLFERWWPGGTREISFSTESLHSELKAAGRETWRHPKDIPESKWRSLTASLPKICIRSADMNDKPLSKWEDFASIAAIWCDY